MDEKNPLELFINNENKINQFINIHLEKVNNTQPIHLKCLVVKLEKEIANIKECVNTLKLTIDKIENKSSIEHMVTESDSQIIVNKFKNRIKYSKPKQIEKDDEDEDESIEDFEEDCSEEEYSYDENSRDEVLEEDNQLELENLVKQGFDKEILLKFKDEKWLKSHRRYWFTNFTEYGCYYGLKYNGKSYPKCYYVNKAYIFLSYQFKQEDTLSFEDVVEFISTYFPFFDQLKKSEKQPKMNSLVVEYNKYFYRNVIKPEAKLEFERQLKLEKSKRNSN